LEKFIPLEDAAQKYGLQMHVLTDLVEKGKLRAVQINHTVAVAEGEVFEFVKETHGNGKKYAKAGEHAPHHAWICSNVSQSM
jgi:hypothetical protein